MGTTSYTVVTMVSTICSSTFLSEYCSHNCITKIFLIFLFKGNVY